MRTTSTIITAVALLGMCGCASQRIGDFTLLSTKNVDISEMEKYERVGSRQDARDMKNSFQLYVGSVPSMEEAVDNAMEQIPGCRALVDVSVKAVSRAFSAGYEIEGECLVDPGVGAKEVE